MNHRRSVLDELSGGLLDELSGGQCGNSFVVNYPPIRTQYVDERADTHVEGGDKN